VAGLVRAVAAGLRADGVRPGDRVAVFGGNTPDWIVLDLAVLAAGAVTVPIYPTASRVQVGHVLADSGAVRVLAETADQVALSGAESFAAAHGARGRGSSALHRRDRRGRHRHDRLHQRDHRERGRLPAGAVRHRGCVDAAVRGFRPRS